MIGGRDAGHGWHSLRRSWYLLRATQRVSLEGVGYRSMWQSSHKTPAHAVAREKSRLRTRVVRVTFDQTDTSNAY